MKPRIDQRGRWLIGLAVASLAAVLSGSVRADDAALAERDLAELRERVETIEEDLARQSARRDETQRELRATEKSAANVRRKLQQIETELAATDERIALLEQRVAESRRELARQVEGLEREIRRAYMQGRDDWLRAVLSQQDPVAIGRQLVYSSYFARERSELAASLRTDLDVLDRSLAELDAERQRKGETRAREQARLDELAQLRQQRSTTLAAINRGITSDSEQLERTRREVAQLESLVTELTQALFDMPLGDALPFAETRGRLSWPTSGRIAQRFGQPRADGRLRWEGVLLAASAGTDVQAVHHGRVVYADWLQGMGLLVIIEHGDGFLSLYGHNQDIVAEVGEWVTPGTVIAHVGDSGGQSVPGLYFEIRQDGKPVDPARWVGTTR